MRRLIAYIMMAVSMLIAVGVTATPVLTKLNGGREFTSGREISFKIESKDETELPADAAEKVADEMRARLDKWHIEDYSVKIQGNDTVAASFSVEKDIFDYVAKYLSFSGGDVCISAANPETLKKDVFKLDEAEIIYQQDIVPIVLIPVTDSGKGDIENLVKQLNPEEGEGGETTKGFIRRDEHDHDHGAEEGGEGGETATPDIFLWTNYEEGDLYEKASVDPLVKDKILMSFFSKNIWYEKEGQDEKDAHTKVAFICGSANEAGEYDLSKLKDANLMANYYLNMLQAKAYDYTITCPTRNVTTAGIDYYTNSLEVPASMESLLVLSNTVNVKMSTTLIATLIAFVIVSLLLVVYYRLTALAIVSTAVSSLFITIVTFSSMNVLFNIPAIIGLIILTTGILFSEIYYANRFKEEVYKGRSLKKANQEASKKSNLITVDVSVIMAFTGLMMYALGGTALKPMGVVLFFGAVFSLLMNLIIFKILMKFLTNSTNLANKYNVFNIEASKVPNLLNAEVKESYTSPYEKVDFTKRRKLSGIILGALVVGAIAVITVFGIKDGSPLNVKNATKNTTVVYTSLRQDNGIIEDVETFKEYALKDVKVNDSTTFAPDKIDMKKVTNYVYSDSSPETIETYYFIVTSSNAFTEEQNDNIANAISDNLTNISIDSESTTIEVKTSKELIYTPDQRLVALATAISIIGVSFYAALRFGPSRGVSLLVTSAGSTAIAYGLFVATRVGTTAVTSLGMPIVAVSTIVAALFYFVSEKAMLKEHRNELNPDLRKEIMVKSLAKSAAPMLILMLITIYLSINFFGFGVSQTTFLFASSLVGEIVAVIAILTVLGPLACVLGKLFGKINLPKLKMLEHKEKQNVQHKRNSSEPEETIFIGIND